MNLEDKLEIEDQSRPSNWKKLTKLALDYYYKDTLQNYCATGKRNSPRPGIDSSIYNAIFGKFSRILFNETKTKKQLN